MIVPLLQAVHESPTPHVDGGTPFAAQILVLSVLVVTVILLYLLFRDHQPW